MRSGRGAEIGQGLPPLLPPPLPCLDSLLPPEPHLAPFIVLSPIPCKTHPSFCPTGYPVLRLFHFPTCRPFLLAGSLLANTLPLLTPLRSPSLLSLATVPAKISVHLSMGSCLHPCSHQAVWGGEQRKGWEVSSGLRFPATWSWLWTPRSPLLPSVPTAPTWLLLLLPSSPARCLSCY